MSDRVPVADRPSLEQRMDDVRAVIARQIERFRGRKISTTGGSFLATFDGPARAIRCAEAIIEEVRTLGLEVRAGLILARSSSSVTTSRGSRCTSLPASARRPRRTETLNERRRARSGGADGESDVLAKIAGMPEPDRVMPERLHAIIKANAPTLASRTWYGMPAFAKDDKVVCFFQSGQKFKARYATLGFQRLQISTRVTFGQPPLPLKTLTPPSRK